MHSVPVAVMLVAQSCLTVWPHGLNWYYLMEKPCTEPGSRASPVLSHWLQAAPVERGGQDLCPQTRLLGAARPSIMLPRPASLEGRSEGVSQGPCSRLSPSSQASASRSICCFCSWHLFPHLRVTIPRFRGWRMGKEPQPCPSLFGSGETNCRVKLTFPTCLLL